MPRFWLGGYTADSGGIAEGIGVLTAGGADDALAGGPLRVGSTAASAASPSWLTPHSSLDVVYAALEGEGAVRAYRRVAADRLAPLGSAVAVGEGVCHVEVSPDGRMLVASCWGNGAVVVLPLGADGGLGRAVATDAAVDPYAVAGAADARSADGTDLSRAAAALRAAVGAEFAGLVPFEEGQAAAAVVPEAVLFGRSAGEGPAAQEPRASRAHQAVSLPGGEVVTTDMGFDLVRFWRRAESGLVAGQQLALPEGTGPRHLVSHPSGHLHVLTELTGEVFTLGRDRDGTWRILSATALSPARGDGDFGAEIALSHDASVVYGGLRGSNTIATLRVRGDGGSLEPVALVESGVEWPRHHLVVRDTLLVAGERSNAVASLTLDTRTGVPGRVRHRADAPSPTCILPARR